MPEEDPETRLKFVHITEDLIFDLEGLYNSIGEAADPVRDALAEAIRMMMRNEWLGTTFAFNFYSGYIFTFRIDTHFNQEKPIEEHYFLKNLYRKK
jgi:hypothetical protein